VAGYGAAVIYHSDEFPRCGILGAFALGGTTMMQALKPALWLGLFFVGIAVVAMTAMYITGEGPHAFDFP
jgi:hypothetical protein